MSLRLPLNPFGATVGISCATSVQIEATAIALVTDPEGPRHVAETFLIEVETIAQGVQTLAGIKMAVVMVVGPWI